MTAPQIWSIVASAGPQAGRIGIGTGATDPRQALALGTPGIDTVVAVGPTTGSDAGAARTDQRALADDVLPALLS